MAEQAESFREAGDFQDFLAGGRIPQKTSRHEIHEGVMIVEVAEKESEAMAARVAGAMRAGFAGMVPEDLIGVAVRRAASWGG